jgi:hypothetical protein
MIPSSLSLVFFSFVGIVSGCLVAICLTCVCLCLLIPFYINVNRQLWVMYAQLLPIHISVLGFFLYRLIRETEKQKLYWVFSRAENTESIYSRPRRILHNACTVVADSLLHVSTWIIDCAHASQVPLALDLASQRQSCDNVITYSVAVAVTATGI